MKSRGTLPMAVAGSADLDVTQIDPESVRIDGLAAIKWSYDDVTAPTDGAVGGDCTTVGPDGIMDLVLKFDRQELGLGIKALDGDVVSLNLYGYLDEAAGGGAVYGSDDVLIIDKTNTNPNKVEIPASQWAVTATASSEWSPNEWSAQQATGEPNTFECGDIQSAWAPLSNGTDPEWIELGFAIPAPAIGLQVHETNRAGFIYQVDLIDTDGVYHTIWTGTDNTPCPGWFELSFEETSYVVERVRLYTQAPSWEEVDAVALLADPGKLSPGQ